MKFKNKILDPFGNYDITKDIIFSKLDIDFIYEAQTCLEYLNKNRIRKTGLSINYEYLFISVDDCVNILKVDSDKVLVPEAFFKNVKMLLYKFLIENFNKRITKHYLQSKIVKRKYTKKSQKNKIKSIK